MVRLLQGFFLPIVISLLLGSVLVVCAPRCNGTEELFIVYNDKQISYVFVNGNGSSALFSTLGIGTSESRLPPISNSNSYAGENGVLISYDGRRALVIPAGNIGRNNLDVFDIDTETWSKIEVYCPPVGVAYRYGEIIGFCAVNTSVPFPCVPYFRAAMRNGEWTDVSRRGLCSYSLYNANLTNTIILQYDSQYGYETKMYFVERGANLLHKIDLGNQEAERHDIPNYASGHEIKIDHLVPAIAHNGSFIGFRLELSTTDGIISSYFSSITESFSEHFVLTDTIPIDSYNLTYLVSFASNLRTVVIYEDGITKQFLLTSMLDDPNLCANLVGPRTHYVICLTQVGYGVMLINVTEFHSVEMNISKIILTSNVPFVHIEVMGRKTFYLLNSQQEVMFYAIAGSDVIPLETLTLRNTGFRIINSANNIRCEDHAPISSESNDGNGLPAGVIISIVVAVVALLAVLSLATLYVIYCKKRKNIPSSSSEASISHPVAQCTSNEQRDLPYPPLDNPPPSCNQNCHLPPLVNYHEEPTTLAYIDNLMQQNHVNNFPKLFIL